jgi:regulator of sigma E protease
MGSNVYLDKQEVRDIPYTDRRMLLVDMNDNSALKNTGIQIGDRIVKMSANGEVLENETLTSFAASDFIQAHNNAQILITFVDKNGNTSEISAVPKAGIVEGKKLLGAKFSDSTFKKYSFFEAIPQAVKTTYEQLIFIFTSLWGLLNDMLFHNAKVEDNLSGPVGLAIMTSQVSTQGLDQILIFAAMLSLSLAAFNILPIPALDGGRIVFVLAEIVKGKKIRPSTEQMFHGLGFLALLGLMVFITYFDIVKALALNS